MVMSSTGKLVKSGRWKKNVPHYTINQEAELVGDKAIKVAGLDGLTITHNTVFYDADNKSIGNMSAVVALAGWKFNQALANGFTVVEAYQIVYKDTTVNWKGADNLVHTVQAESICETLEVSMIEVATILKVQ